ncbi:MAG: GNAT family N-acetyltransferase [Sphingobacteriales bacterium]|nr:MAG: GNAT family N-acetyltransferase [Sphingobacteriales bacterium]
MKANIYIRLLQKEEAIPYGLLLLADEEMQAIEKYIHESSIYVAKQNDTMVGVYVVFPVNEQTAEIKAIAVDEFFQNLGIGKFMLEDATARAIQNGFTELIIGTPTTAKKQLAIYKQAGFIQYDVKKDFFIANYFQPIFEDGVQLTDMAMLRKTLT